MFSEEFPGDCDPSPHSLEQVNELYDYLIETYGVETQRQCDEYGITRSDAQFERSELPKLTGVAAVKAAILGDKRPQPEPIKPVKHMHTETKRMVEMPVLPARNPNDTRTATLLRRTYSDRPAGEQILFQSVSVRSEAEARSRNIHTTTVDTAPGSVLYHGLSKGKIPAEASPSWHDYLSKVKDYLDSGRIDEHGYGPFIDENHELIEQVEHEMGFTENDKEIVDNARWAYESQQTAQTQAFFESAFKGVPFTEWETYYIYSSLFPEYDHRTRSTVVKPALEYDLPSLEVRQVEKKSQQNSSGLPRGLTTTYEVRILDDSKERSDQTTVSYNSEFKVQPKHDTDNGDRPVIQDYKELAEQLAPGIISESCISDIESTIKPLNIYDPNEAVQKALWNQVFGKYIEASED